MSHLPKITQELIKKYQEELALSFSEATLKRKSISLNKFLDWAKTNSLIDYSLEHKNIPARTAVKRKHNIPGVSFLNIAILVVLSAAIGFGVYNQFFKKTATPFAATSLTRPNRYLSFQGRLTNQYGNPVTAPTNVVFQLYNVATGGSNLWTSGTCSVSPDTDGVFSTLLGSTCGSDLSSSIFSDNAAVWLGVTVGSDIEATPRIQIATVAYALNSETLQGYPASSSATINTVPVMNNSGQIVLAASSPKIESTTGNFAVEGQAITIDTPTASNGNVNISPDGTGQVNLTFSGSSPGSGTGMVNATDANLNSGSLYYGSVANGSSGYNLLQLQSGSSPTDKFVVDSAGNVTAAGTINGLTTSDGVINSGTWHGSTIASNYGGTGADNSGAAQYSVPYYSGTGVLGGAVSPGTSGYVLSTNSTGGAPSWIPMTATGTNYWKLADGAVSPFSDTLDVLIGNSATTSAKFAFTGVDGGIPTASIAGAPATNVATYLTGNGNLATTNMADLTLGGSSTGNVILNSRGSTALTANGTGVTLGGTTTFGGQTYTWPGSQTANGFLQTNGSGTLGWTTSLPSGTTVGFDKIASGTNTTAAMVVGTGASLDYSGGTINASSLGGATFASPGSIGNTVAGTGKFTTLTSTGATDLANAGASNVTIATTGTGNVTIGNGTGTLALASNGGLNVTTVGALTGVASIDTIAHSATAITFAGAGSVTSTGANALSVDGGASGALNLNGTSTGDVNIAGGSGSTGCTVTNSNGNLTCSGTISATGGVTASSIPFSGITGATNSSGQALVVGGTSSLNYSGGGTINASSLEGNTWETPGTIGSTTPNSGTFITVNATSGLYTGAASGTQRIDASGNLVNIGTTQIHGVTYTWPVADAGVSGYVLSSNAAGALSWIAQSGGANYWKLASGAISPFSDTLDVLIGNSATTSAKFAFTGVSSGTPTASIAGTVTNVATFIDGNGNISSTNRNNLTLGNSSTYNTTGNLLLNPNGMGNVGIGTASPIAKLSIVGTSTNATGKAALLIDQYESQDILTASASGTTKMTLASDGTLSLYNATSSIANTSGDITINPSSGNTSFSGGNLININNITAAGVLNVGGLNGVTYNAFAGGGDTPASTAITTSNDLFIGGDEEIKGGLYLTGRNIYNVVGGVSNGTIAFAASPASVNNYNTLGYGSWMVDNATNPGIAAFMINQEKGTVASGDILSASASGIAKFTIHNDSSFTMAGLTSAPSVNTTAGTVYFNTTTAAVNGGTTGDLMVRGEDGAWHRVALDMTEYSNSNASLANGAALTVTHNQNTNDINATAWFYDTVDSTWKNISAFTNTIIQNLQNQFDAVGNSKTRTYSALTDVALSPSVNVGTGADGAGSVVAGQTATIDTMSISGRSCADAVNYNVATNGLNTPTQAVLTTTPAAGCLSAGDEVLLINLQGTNSAFSNVGKYETLRVSGVSTNTVTFTTPKINYYGDNATDDTNIGTANGTQRVMLQRVPNYTSVTVASTGILTTSGWNGSLGGVLFFRATGAVSISGTAHENYKGYGRLPARVTGGGPGGESFCGPGGTPNNGNGAGGAGGPDNVAVAAGTGYCGGGGGAGRGGTAGIGSTNQGGAGGGGGANLNTPTLPGGGGGGYGTFGYGGSNGGNNGSTNQSGNGGAAAGGGGGGGTYGSSALTTLMFGSAGGGGGWDGGANYTSGGAGGGIVFISANSITVSGAVQSNGQSPSAASGGGAWGGSGGGAGGSVKLMGNTVNIGTNLISATGGTGIAGSNANWLGGNGGNGITAVYDTTSYSGSANSPAPTYTIQPYYPYGIYNSAAIATTNAVSFDKIKWDQNLNTYGRIELQTRTGNSTNPTDGSWEAWKPAANTTTCSGSTCSSLVAEGASAYTNWQNAYTLNVAAGDVTRSVTEYEDDAQGTAANLTKLSASGFQQDTGSTLTTNLDSYWPLNEASGNRSDSFGTNTLAQSGSAVSGTGIIGNGVALVAASSQYLACTDANCGGTTTGKLDMTASQSFSLAAWFKTSTTGTTKIIMSKKSVYNNDTAGYIVYLDTSNKLNCKISDGTAGHTVTKTSTNTYTDGNWHDVVCSINRTGQTLTMYIDGTADAGGTVSTSATSATLDTGSDFRIGTDGSATASTYFNGTIDEASVWLKAMTTTEITDLFNVGGANTYPSSGQYAQASIGSIDIRNYDYLTYWIRASQTGNSVKFGFGDTLATTNEQIVTIDTANTWQKVYVDLASFGSNKDAVTKLRFTNLSSGANTIYVGYVHAEKLLSTNTGSQITSTPNNYIQYRAIFTTTNTSYQPILNNVNIAYNDGFKIVQATDENSVSLYNETGSTQNMRLDVTVFGADLAEYYTVDDPSIAGGDVVALTGQMDEDGVPILTKAKSQSDPNLIGIISTNAGQTLGIAEDNRRLLSLAGRVPVNIDPSSPAIVAGDGITSSETPGMATKASFGDTVIAKAAQSWNPGDGSTLFVIVNSSNSQSTYLTSIQDYQLMQDVITGAWSTVSQTTNEAVKTAGVFADLIASNIKAGAIVTSDLATNTFSAFQGTVDNLLVRSGLVAWNIQTKLISPVPDGTDVTVQIGSEATPSGQFVIQNASGSAVATIDNTGNATFSGQVASSKLQVASEATISGTLYADNIKSQSLDDIQALLTKVETDQNLLTEASGWNVNTASSSSQLTNQLINQLNVSDLYVTNQAAINSLSVTNSLALGSDLILSSLIDQSTNQPINSLDSLSAPLRIQSLAMAPVEIMDGLVTIDTKGNVNIAGDLAVSGDLNVSGRVASAGLTLKDNNNYRDLQGENLYVSNATASANLLTLQNINGDVVSSVDASGSAQFNNLTTGGLTIASDNPATASGVINGVITTNATAGQGIIPAGTSEITIKNPKITDYTLVYVTPTSPTQNYVLYIKSKEMGQFVVGFSAPLNSDVSFNWWIVQVSQ